MSVDAKPSELRYSILCDAEFKNAERANSNFPPPILKDKYTKSSLAFNIKNWKRNYQEDFKACRSFAASFLDSKELHRTTPKDQYADVVDKKSEEISLNSIRWKWMTDKVPEWHQKIPLFRKDLVARFNKQNQQLQLDTSYGITVYLNENDWKLFKGGQFQKINLVKVEPNGEANTEARISEHFIPSNATKEVQHIKSDTPRPIRGYTHVDIKLPITYKAGTESD